MENGRNTYTKYQTSYTLKSYLKIGKFLSKLKKKILSTQSLKALIATKLQGTSI